MPKFSETTMAAHHVEFGDIIDVAGFPFQVLEIIPLGSSVSFSMKPVHNGRTFLDGDTLTLGAKNRQKITLKRKI